jgi:hypothetical protein
MKTHFWIVRFALTLMIALALGLTVAAQENIPLPAGSTIFIAPMEGGLDTFVSAAVSKKAVPVRLVNSREQADFEVTGKFVILIYVRRDIFIDMPASFTSTEIHLPNLPNQTKPPEIAEAVDFQVVSCKTAGVAFSSTQPLSLFRRELVRDRPGIQRVSFDGALHKQGRKAAEWFAEALKTKIKKSGS